MSKYESQECWKIREKKGKFRVEDNFLGKKEFANLRDAIMRFDFPWNFNPTVVHKDASGPGYFHHVVYENNVPTTPFYDYCSHILEQMNVVVLYRIRINLYPRLPEHYFSDFHTDSLQEMEESIVSQWTNSILYINTNNGFTELEGGERIESVANRLVSFSLNTRHRFVTQTDEQTRYVINFNYLKLK